MTHSVEHVLRQQVSWEGETLLVRAGKVRHCAQPARGPVHAWQAPKLPWFGWLAELAEKAPRTLNPPPTPRPHAEILEKDEGSKNKNTMLSEEKEVHQADMGRFAQTKSNLYEEIKHELSGQCN